MLFFFQGASFLGSYLTGDQSLTSPHFNTPRARGRAASYNLDPQSPSLGKRAREQKTLALGKMRKWYDVKEKK